MSSANFAKSGQYEYTTFFLSLGYVAVNLLCAIGNKAPNFQQLYEVVYGIFKRHSQDGDGLGIDSWAP